MLISIIAMVWTGSLCDPVVIKLRSQVPSIEALLFLAFFCALLSINLGKLALLRLLLGTIQAYLSQLAVTAR